MAQAPKPRTVAIVAADQEFSRNGSDGARENAKKAGLRIVYDKTYPPSTTDFAPIVRAVAATNPDLLVICSYPPDSVGMVKAVNEIGFRPKMIGGGMVGLQATALKVQLGPMLDGFVNYDWWLPIPKMCSATSSSARTANGRNRGCCKSSSMTSRPTTSSSSAQ
jgi:branched-chain amino acid transport system substrate-binding protein